jgi:excinuclease UvrABC ATPase subunit
MDEPTGGLDVSVQARLLDLLRGLVTDLGLAAIIVTHDLAVARLQRLLCDDAPWTHRPGPPVAPPAPIAESSATTSSVACRFTPMKVASGTPGRSPSVRKAGTPPI